MAIIIYHNVNAQYIITCDHNITVQEFAGYLNRAKAALSGAAIASSIVASANGGSSGITAYYGFHGNDDGSFYATFDNDEMAMADHMAQEFTQNFAFKKISTNVNTEDIVRGFGNENPFFTWCNSETTLNKVLGDLTTKGWQKTICPAP